MGQKTSQRDTPEMLLEIWSKCSLFTHLSRSRRGIANGRCGASTVVAVNETNDRSGWKAGIADEPFSGVIFGVNLRQTLPLYRTATKELVGSVELCKPALACT